MAAEGIIVNLLAGRRKHITLQGAIVEVLVFSTVTIIAGFLAGLGWTYADMIARSSLREVKYNAPYILPRGLQDELSVS